MGSGGERERERGEGESGRLGEGEKFENLQQPDKN